MGDSKVRTDFFIVGLGDGLNRLGESPTRKCFPWAFLLRRFKMKKDYKLAMVLLVTLAFLYLAGCAMPPLSNGMVHKGVQVFFGIPDRPYEEIGDISAGSFWTHKGGEAVSNLCKEAEKLGGDALINVKVIEPKWYESGGARAVGTVIRWKEE